MASIKEQKEYKRCFYEQEEISGLKRLAIKTKNRIRALKAWKTIRRNREDKKAKNRARALKAWITIRNKKK